jgi:hypothetical protein
LAQAALPGIVNLSSGCELWHTRRMNTPASDNRYKNHRFPAEIISQALSSSLGSPQQASTGTVLWPSMTG